MNTRTHEELKAKIWEIANRLRGPYRPPQYRLVMLPMVVLRRLDCVLEPTKDAVLKRRDELEAQQMPEAAMIRLLGKAADPERKHALYNTSPYTFTRLLGDAENIAPNLVSYINGFAPTARHIFERFKFADQIDKLDSSNRLFTVVRAMANVDLHPDRIDNLQMGYLFEHLVMRFNEQSNEEAGDHFTPREVIRLMANLYFERGIDELPADVSGFHKNITGDSLKTQLSATLGISENIHVPETGSTRQPLGVSSRHAILFCLQTQDELDLPPRAVPHPMLVPAPVEGREGRASSGTRATA